MQECVDVFVSASDSCFLSRSKIVITYLILGKCTIGDLQWLGWPVPCIYTILYYLLLLDLCSKSAKCCSVLSYIKRNYY